MPPVYVITPGDLDANGCYTGPPIPPWAIVVFVACTVKFCGTSFVAMQVITTCQNLTITADGDVIIGSIIQLDETAAHMSDGPSFKSGESVKSKIRVQHGMLTCECEEIGKGNG